MTASPLAACPLQPMAEGRVSAGMGMAHFASPRASSGGGTPPAPQASLRGGGPHLPQLPSSQAVAHNPPFPNRKGAISSPGTVGPSCDAAPRGGLRPSTPSAEPASLVSGAGAAGAGVGPHQQTPSPAAAGSLAPRAEPKDVPASYRGPQSSPLLPSPPSAPITSPSLSHGLK